MSNQTATVDQNTVVYQCATVSDKHEQKMVNVNVAIDYAGHTALAKSMALRLSNPKKVYGLNYSQMNFLKHLSKN